MSGRRRRLAGCPSRQWSPVADEVEFDTSELDELRVRLNRASDELAGEVVKIVKRGALAIKKDMQDAATGSDHFSRMPASITYETFYEADAFVAEIGPEIGKLQGSLAFLAYEGTHTGGPVFADPALSLAREVPKVMDYISRAAEGSL